MRAFHIDMNMAHFRPDYLETWLHRLASWGFDTVLWELENHVQWETCPECVGADALSKDRLRALLELANDLGLESIPLFQTLGHCEYVLQNGRFPELRETDESDSQYCPQSPELVPFLQRWIDEYLEIFGAVRYFHLGADEARSLGVCPRCREFVESHSVSKLFVDHINKLAEPLIGRGIKPIIWPDMVLGHPEALRLLSRKIVLFDWEYRRWDHSPVIPVWGDGYNKDYRREDIPAEILTRYSAYIFPNGDTEHGQPDPFYTAAFLIDEGFEVMVCPTSSSYGDNVFTPRMTHHMRNVRDSVRKGKSVGNGWLLTSWTVHLFPWEFQEPCIQLAARMDGAPDLSLGEFKRQYVRDAFGLDDDRFWEAANRLSGSCLFTHTASLGFGKEAVPVPDGYILKKVNDLAVAGETLWEMELCRKRETEYGEALETLEVLLKEATRGSETLQRWVWAAESLRSRAQAAGLLLQCATDPQAAEDAKISERLAGALDEHRRLRAEAIAWYKQMVGPARAAQMVAYMYDSVIAALEDQNAGS